MIERSKVQFFAIPKVSIFSLNLFQYFLLISDTKQQNMWGKNYEKNKQFL